MDEDHDEVRFVCKLCDKRFPSGKSLGGHMRSHVIANANATVTVTANSSESDDKFDNFEAVKKHPALMINGNSNSYSYSYSNVNSYGLRDNPKRSWRASSSSTLSSPNERICKQCGKGFQSLKALCGHMAFHSEKDKNLKDYDDDSWTSENLDHEDKLSEDSSEENEQQDPVSVTRSRSKRYKKVVIKPPSFSLTNSASNASNYIYGSSSSVSEIEGFEQEDVAMCLMMLSKDSGNWAGVNSVSFETKFSSTKSEKGWNLDKNVESRNWDCRNGMKDFNYKDLSYEEKQEIRRNLFREFGYDDSLKKRIQEDDGSYKKRSKYECLNCNKTFSSFQGLGGHRPCHKRNNNSLNSRGDGSDVKFGRDQTDKFEKKARLKKNKGHECPICFRMFKSGQALGGHKRSHFINGSEDRITGITAMQHAVATYTDMIDLNLPAPEED